MSAHYQSPGREFTERVRDASPSRSTTPVPTQRMPVERGDRMLFSGNRHETVPRLLLTDPRLTPLDRNAWQIFRMSLIDDGATAFPTYEDLRPYLASIPCSAASHETIARVLTVLRLTRWITLAHRYRDPITGFFQGNLYVLHDEPLSPHESILLDPEYLGLISQALDHSSKSIRIVGSRVLEELAGDPLITSRSLPTRIQQLTARIAAASHRQTQATPVVNNGAAVAHPSSESEGGMAPSSDSEDRAQPSSDSEDGEFRGKDNHLRNPKNSTVSTEYLDAVRTEAHDGRSNPLLRLPVQFSRLSPEQQAAAITALQQLPASLQQDVLDEWEARCQSAAVRKPAHYLFGLIQRGLRGDFQTWAARLRPSEQPAVNRDAQQLSTEELARRRRVASENVAKLRAMIEEVLPPPAR